MFCIILYLLLFKTVYLVKGKKHTLITEYVSEWGSDWVYGLNEGQTGSYKYLYTYYILCVQEVVSHFM